MLYKMFHQVPSPTSISVISSHNIWTYKHEHICTIFLIIIFGIYTDTRVAKGLNISWYFSGLWHTQSSSRAHGVPTPVHRQTGSRDEWGSVRGEEGYGRGNLDRFTGPPESVRLFAPLEELGVRFGVEASPLLELGLHNAWVHRVHSHLEEESKHMNQRQLATLKEAILKGEYISQNTIWNSQYIVHQIEVSGEYIYIFKKLG